MSDIISVDGDLIWDIGYIGINLGGRPHLEHRQLNIGRRSINLAAAGPNLDRRWLTMGCPQLNLGWRRFDLESGRINFGARWLNMGCQRLNLGR